MILIKKFWLILFLFLINCSSIPKNTADGCSIFSERYLWYKHSKKTEQKWGTPIYIQLATKNGILIVEFANQLRAEGKNIKTAVIESASIRLRPILMTSSSTVLGVLPLIISSGPGEASRLTVGITIFAGMFFSTFFTLNVIPVIYLIIG